MKKEKQIEFLLASINDIQSTIRAFDNKIIAIIVVIILPLSQLKLLISIYSHLIIDYLFIGILTLSVFVITWLLSLIFSILCILSIENPASKIVNDCNAKGIFYGAGLFKINYRYLLFRKKLVSTKSISDYSKDFKLKEIKKELVYEQMKLTFIRDVKSKRQKIALISATLSILIGVLSWLFVLIEYNIG
ncbi:hypothetical protein [Draconibacterium orientale]|uniref:hypothetical protein n=1 Tax=Draconibacterium orientale TaxID=1168034 RepID=UPI0029C08762|nr:hypothetical protein [Draconibacterium orientale]